MTLPDLDPEDLLARINLRAELVAVRKYHDWSRQLVSREAGFLAVGAVATLERQTSWEACRVQQWARGLHRVFRMHITGLEIPADDMRSLVLKAATAFGSFDEDQLHLRVAAADLIRTRQAMRVSRADLARRMGVDERAVRGWEDDPLPSLLRLYQRYTRALGGAVELDLLPATVGVAS